MTPTHHSCPETLKSQLFNPTHGDTHGSARPRGKVSKLWSACPACAPWAAAASLAFSSGLSCSIVPMTGSSRARSLPGFRRMNCSSTFFRYSRLAADCSRAWFLSSRLISLFRSWCQRKECRRVNTADWRNAVFFLFPEMPPKWQQRSDQAGRKE